ncbi:rhamnulokinase family protein [Umezawaea sp. Da 62-37]|uniref:rhamnulokinase n=1 Tax=Umezawaea sp. Da 62-37 TaxID=3075927 RepID=UPI0028F6DFF8|nr:rhamnulokinase family protein [Umezawaea sp. Da 62-37]WNV86460.1 rhamnulokinase family protein [Umezawaea sp. Da 62-37]
MKRFAAVDLGASSGRVIVGEVDGNRVALHEAHRFPNRPVKIGRTLHWDVLDLYREVVDGLRLAGPLDGIGVDSWAVDYGLLDRHGALVGNPVHYRDERTGPAVERARGLLPAEAHYAATGIQFQPFNTAFQLLADDWAARGAVRALLVPDLIAFWLTGREGTEITNASTTAMLDPRTRAWSEQVAEALGLDTGLFAPLREPGSVIGEVLPGIGLSQRVPVYAVGSHDTASAVVAVPARDDNFAYISCGTWSLVGVELADPVLTEESRRANFTNELGVDGTIRFLRNVMGLWLLQECHRAWGTTDPGALLAEAAALPPSPATVDATDSRFLAPGDMPDRIAAACRETGRPEPRTRAELVRCVLDSLALAHRDAVADAARLSGRKVDVVHVVGGGARNELLCQLTADACGLPVVAGPVEASALGNVLVQARAAGALDGDLRTIVRSTEPLATYTPRPEGALGRGA